MRKDDDDSEEGFSGFMIGALHTLDDFEPDEPEYAGPKIRMGFHPPEKAYE
jgi:hypothetical protein